MSGELKHRERLGVAVKKELASKLRELSNQTRIPASKLVDEALEDLLKKHGIEVSRE